MPEILALLQTIEPLLEKKTLRQMCQVVFAMLAISGRITMLGLSRWAEKGGAYRTIQRFYYTEIPWKAIQWLFFRLRLLKPEDEHIFVGDEVVLGKAGKATYGLDRFFSGLQKQVIPGLSFFAFSLVNVREEHSYPMQITQIVKTSEEKAASKAKAEAKKAKKTEEKRKPGRPKGSKNKSKQDVVLNPELLRIQASLQSLIKTMDKVISPVYLALDGHFGNYPSAMMVRKEGLHLISKMRSDAGLYIPFEGEYKKTGPKPKYGAKLDMANLDKKYLMKSFTDDHGLPTDIYQGNFWNKEFPFLLNVVIIIKTNPTTKTQAHVILFCTDLGLSYDKIIKFYSLRFQIEFNFRDAKQYWGLEDFMNVKKTAVTNAANLSFFMVNFSQALLQPFRKIQLDFSILDLKAHYRGYRYVLETIKMLLEKPDAISLSNIFQKIARLGAIHPVSIPADTP
jgi:putative transposase